MGTLLNRRRVMGGGGENPYDEYGYIKKGKVFHLDGIDKGSDPSAWTDLVTGLSFPYVSGVVAEENHVRFDNGHSDCIANGSYGEFGLGGTFEIVVKTSSANVFNPGLGPNFGLMSYYGAFTPYCSTNSPSGGYSKSISETSNLNVIIALTFTRRIYYTFNCQNGNSYGYSRLAPYEHPTLMKGSYGEIYAIRVYDHVLSQDEVFHNKDVDNSRFGLELEFTGTVTT